MKLQSICTSIAFLILTVSVAQERNPFYVGHSLVNHNMPIMVQALAIDDGKTTYFDKQIINGSPLKYNFENAANAEGTPYTSAFPDGEFNTLVVTEAVPLQNHLTWSGTFEFADNFYNFAKDNNNDIPVRFYIYETWHCINSGIPQPDAPTGCFYDDSENSNTLWHPRLQLDFPLWSGIVTDVREQNPSDDEIWMVPAGQAFYNLTTEIIAGNVPGITDFTELFKDDIHLTNAGNYFVACVMYSTIYRESPEGLTSTINNEWNVPFDDMPSAELATVMQEIAWNTVTDLSEWTGVSETVLSNDVPDKEKPMLSIYPNPASDNITIRNVDLNEDDSLQIYDSMGVLVKNIPSKYKVVDISDLSGGLYFIQLGNDSTSSTRFIKE